MSFSWDDPFGPLRRRRRRPPSKERPRAPRRPAPRPAPSPEELAAAEARRAALQAVIDDYLARPLSVAAAAAIHGMNPKTLARHLRLRGISPEARALVRRRAAAQERDAAAAIAAQDVATAGLSIREAAAAHEVSEFGVQRACWAADIDAHTLWRERKKAIMAGRLEAALADCPVIGVARAARQHHVDPSALIRLRKERGVGCRNCDKGKRPKKEM